MMLLCEIAGHRYGAPLAAVREVFALGPLTPVPTAPAAVAGLVNLRNQVVAVIDPALLLGLGLHSLRRGAPVVLVEIEDARAGLVVERVLGLTHVAGPALSAAADGAARRAPAAAIPLLAVAELLTALRRDLAAAATPPAGGHPYAGAPT